MARPAIIVTRPLGDALITANALSTAGFAALVAPCLYIEVRKRAKIELAILLERRCQAIIVTSKHAVAALAEFLPDRQIPIIAVGRVTAAAALRKGFANVKIVPGTVRSLHKSITEYAAPDGGQLLYAAGRHVTSNVEAVLGAQGYDIVKIILYTARALESLPSETLEAMIKRTAKAVMFFSARSAALFIKRAHESDLSSALTHLHAVCFSRAIASTLKPQEWKSIAAATVPTVDAMILQVKKLFPADQ